MKWLICVLLIVVCGCSNGDGLSHGRTLKQWMTPNGKIKVLPTIAMIDDLVTQIGGDYIDSTVLIKGELDPHSYQLVKGDDEKFSFADLIFYNGLGLEHGPSLQGNLIKNNKAIGLGNEIINKNPTLVIHYKGQVDPHIWMDISLWAKSIPYIVTALSNKDPQHAEYFRANGDKLMQTLLTVHQEVSQELHQIPSPKRYLVTSHDAFNYFTRAYLANPNEAESLWRERFVAPEGLAPESQISTTDIQAIIDHLTEYHIHILFPESNVNKDSIKKIVSAAKEKGLEVKIADVSLYADAMGKTGSDGDSYIKMMTHNAKGIASQLEHNGG